MYCAIDADPGGRGFYFVTVISLFSDMAGYSAEAAQLQTYQRRIRCAGVIIKVLLCNPEACARVE